MADDLPVDVLTELGRVTWAAIRLEDYAEGLCSEIDPQDPRTDRRPVSAKIRDAQEALKRRAPSAARDQAARWLDRASQVIEQRNAFLHAVPVVSFENGRAGEQRLAEMPRKDRGYRERSLTAESLGELRSSLEEAAAGWRDVVLALAAASGP